MLTLSEKYPFSRRSAIRAEAKRIVTEINALSAPNSPNHSHYMVEIDGGLWRQMNTFDHDFFIANFHGSFSISQLNRGGAPFLMVYHEDLPYFSLTLSFNVHPNRIR